MVLNRKSFFLELGEPAAKADEPKSQPEETVAVSNSELSQPAAATDPVEAEIPALEAAAVDVAPEAESVAAEHAEPPPTKGGVAATDSGAGAGSTMLGVQAAHARSGVHPRLVRSTG